LDDFLEARGTPFDLYLSDLIQRGEALALTDLIYCEVLQGILEEVLSAASELSFIATPFSGCVGYGSSNNARIYRDCRRQGFTIRKTVDCLIAATCLEAGAEIYHNDRDFEAIAKVRRLKIHQPA
jgi:predicted nucleic acid-binding protein